ncbi:MAG: hypothetical protein RIQ97_287 [Pseudomonadota bacterium]|jgi:DNA-binding protein H-NS
MTQSYQDLLKQRAALDDAIAAARQREIADALAKVRALVAEFGLTAADVFPSRSGKAAKSGGAKVAAKYRDPATGKTWTGRGKAPKWIEGQNRDAFMIA